MKIQYIITQEEVAAVKAKHRTLKQAALLNRDAGAAEDSREFYLKAKGYEEVLTLLGIYKKEG